MNFQISSHRTALTSKHFSAKSGTKSTRKKAQDANDLRRHLIDVRVGVEQSFIDDGKLISGADVTYTP